MADDIKETKKKIWEVKQKIKKEEEDRAGWAAALPGAIAAGMEDIKVEVEQSIAQHDAQIAKLQEELDALEAELPRAPEPAVPKFDPEKHPLLRKTVEKAEPEKPVVFNTGDICEAQWTDKAWYKAKIQSILGSISAPKYLVKYLDYNDTLTVDRDAVRPLQNKRKRDPEPAPIPAPQSTPVTSSPHVISGPASLNPDAQAAKKDPTGENGDQKKRRTIGSSKQLEKRVNSWQAFNSKGVGKKFAKKESMFRSGTSVNSRVGFTGSGAGMTQIQKRVRHNNKAEADEDDEESGSFAGRRRF